MSSVRSAVPTKNHLCAYRTDRDVFYLIGYSTNSVLHFIPFSFLKYLLMWIFNYIATHRVVIRSLLAVLDSVISFRSPSRFIENLINIQKAVIHVTLAIIKKDFRILASCMISGESRFSKILPSLQQSLLAVIATEVVNCLPKTLVNNINKIKFPELISMYDNYELIHPSRKPGR